MKVDQVIDILLNSSDESESIEDSDDENETIEAKKENQTQSSFKASKNDPKEEIKPIEKVSSIIEAKEEVRIDNKKKVDVLTDSDDSDDSDDMPLCKLILKKGLNTSNTLNDSSSQVKTSKTNLNAITAATTTVKASSKTNLRKTIFKRRPSIKKEKISCLLKGIYDFMDSNDELIHMNESPNEEVSFVYSDLEDEPTLNWDLVTQRTNEMSAYLDSDSENENNKENLDSLSCSPAIALEKSDKFILSLKNLKRKKCLNY
jgi:hypothetical protein